MPKCSRGEEEHVGYAISIRGTGQSSIDYDEWLAIAEADPTLMDAGESVWNGPEGTVLRFRVFRWESPTESVDDLDQAEFVYHRGRITIDNADVGWTKKIAEVAALLGAEAVGDDGEVYDINGDASPVARPAKPQWWRRLFG